MQTELETFEQEVIAALNEKGFKTEPHPEFPDTYVLEEFGLNLGFRREGGKFVIRGFVHRDSRMHHSEWPSLESCGFGAKVDHNPYNVAERVKREILRPSVPLVDEYRLKIRALEKRLDALPGKMQELRDAGFSVTEPRSAGETEFRFSKQLESGTWLSGRMQSDGKATLENCYLQPGELLKIVGALA